MNRVPLVFLCVASLVIIAQAAEFKHKNVVELHDSDFEKNVSDGSLWFVKLYAPWCGHCKRLAPTWGELADAYAADKGINVAHVDCTESRDVCSKLGIRGYPTLKVFRVNSDKKQESYPHQGARDLESLKKFVEDLRSELAAKASS